MTFEDDLDQAVVHALKLDREREVAPPVARQRVATRLATTAGVLGLSASVAGTTQAAAATLGLPLAAGGAASGAVTALGLAKMLVVGLGLGASVGLGAHVAFTPGAARGGETRGAEQAEPPRRTVLAAPDEQGARWPQPTQAPAAPAASAEQVAALPVSAPPAVSARLAREGSGPSALRAAAANPVPELPGLSAAAANESLAAQQALLDQARGALRDGDGTAALSAIRLHLARFPRTAFEEEREVLAIKALLLAGSAHEALAEFAAFAAAHPTSLLLPSLRSAVAATRSGATRTSQSVTDGGLSAQSPGQSEDAR